MIRPLIILDRPGREVQYLGGILSQLKNRLQLQVLKENENLDRLKPRIIYTVFENTRRIDLGQQYQETKEIADILGFTWETIYTGSDKFNKLHRFNVYEELKRKYLDIVDFYRPDLIITYNSGILENQLNDETVINKVVRGIFSKSNKLNNWIQCGSLNNNYYYSINFDDYLNVIKCININRSIFDTFELNLIKEEIEQDGKKIGTKYVHKLNILLSNNYVLKLMEV